jgi:hypothetical protein
MAVFWVVAPCNYNPEEAIFEEEFAALDTPAGQVKGKII